MLLWKCSAQGCDGVTDGSHELCWKHRLQFWAVMGVASGMVVALWALMRK